MIAFTNDLPGITLVREDGLMNRMKFACCASAAFGLEGLVAGELRELGMQDVTAENGMVRFQASLKDIFRCNLSLHFCDRVLIIMAEGKCQSFEDIYQLVFSVPWERYLSGREALNISARCARSRIMSPRDCQSVSKKAMIERLKSHTALRVFPEDGPPFPVMITVHTDHVRVLLNTSGEALSRRGYRTWNGEAPLRETLAAALVYLSPWKSGMPLYDPCCGTGTIVAEAAWMAAGRLPGLTRKFAMEDFDFCREFDFETVRMSAKERADYSLVRNIGGSDIDPSAVNLAKRHMRQAGVGEWVALSVLPMQEVILNLEDGVFICNPPYGERLSDRVSSRLLYRELYALWKRHPGWSLCAISSDPGFEKAFGKKADKKRRLYNGRLECTYYIYFGTRMLESR